MQRVDGRFNPSGIEEKQASLYLAIECRVIGRPDLCQFGEVSCETIGLSLK